MSEYFDDASPAASPLPSHAVQFYEREEDLFARVAEFLAAGLNGGDGIVVIATPEHRDRFRADVNSRGIDAERAIRSGQLTLVDAREALATFMVDGAPDAARFEESIGGLLDKSAQVWPGRQRAFGEMVNILWQDGQSEAAIQLEELWNDLIGRRGFALLCAYSMGNFYRQSSSANFADVCRVHNEIEHAPTSPQSLHVELEHRKQLEKALREALTARRQAERDLRDFVENAPLGLHWVGPDGTILWANRAELELLGYAREEYVGRNVADFHV
ncbi:MAG TPA: MEDS domain-containing protein, partial [Thermoanaerobaculia bacterium]|nr:MEDS domain-containing protein [Thermoanaerobaculia bacterium]